MVIERLIIYLIGFALFMGGDADEGIGVNLWRNFVLFMYFLSRSF